MAAATVLPPPIADFRVALPQTESTKKLELTSTPQLPCLDRLVQDVIQEQVTSRPNAPAICSWDGYFTYKELDQLSSRLAVHLSSFGVGPDVIVPILCDKSALALGAMLAVSKAGGAFAALDTSHPDERLIQMIHDTKATLLLASPSQSHRFSGLPGLLVQEVSNAMVSGLSPTCPEPLAPHPNASPSDLMYIIWTSGSTGRPKGVMIPHRAFLASALVHGADQNISPKSRVLQFASYAFDMSIMEMFTTFLFGGCVCVPTDADRFGGIAEFVNRTGVNTLYLTPSYARLLDPAAMPSLKTLVVGGEVVPSDLVEQWSLHVGVYIAYGPTETAIQATGVWTGAAPSVTGLIGRPTGCQVWIVREDDHNKPVCAGETGELLIGGDSLARGYLGDETQTKVAFVDFCVGSESRRVYKTGDLVRLASNGNMVLEGRKDTQVKVQGMRFELTEIEARLSEVLPPGSKFCVDKVEVRSSPNQPLLAVFTSTSMEASKSAMPEVCWDRVEEVLAQVPEIRDTLRKLLPATVVPSLYIPVTFIPLASSTKMNRKELRQLAKELSLTQVSRLQKSEKFQEPARCLSAGESIMRELWALVLNREPETIGPDDNFIHLGGDSVTSIRLVSAARNRGLALTSSMILSTPILSHLANKAVVDNTSSKQESIQPFALLPDVSPEELPACGVQVDEIEDILPMTMNQMRWYSKTMVKPDAWLDQYHFRLPSDVDLLRFNSALNLTIAAAELLRARVVVAGPEKKLLLAIVKFRPVEPVIVNDSLEAYLKRDLEISMGIGAPLSRCAIVRGVNASQVFVWTLHHAIYDGYSLTMLLQTIDDFYHGLQPVPFTPFNRYLKGLSEQELAEGESFWKRYLGDSSSWAMFPMLPPPGEKLAPSMQRFLRTVSTPMQQPSSSYMSSITAGTLIRVAYATALSAHSTNGPATTTNNNSILFLETLGGRNSNLPGIERVAGPTLLTCPTKLHPLSSSSSSSSKSQSQALADAQNSLIARIKYENFPLPRLLPLLPGLELRSLLMIEDAATFHATEAHGRLFGDGASELRLDESDAMPMLFRCTVRGSVMDVDVRFDEHVVRGEEIEAFVRTFSGILEELSRGV